VAFFVAYEDEIAEIEAILNAGVTDVATDAVRSSYDQAALRKRLAELKRQQSPAARPRCAQINLENA
jgi:hypothetical protein